MIPLIVLHRLLYGMLAFMGIANIHAMERVRTDEAKNLEKPKEDREKLHDMQAKILGLAPIIWHPNENGAPKPKAKRAKRKDKTSESERQPKKSRDPNCLRVGGITVNEEKRDYAPGIASVNLAKSLPSAGRKDIGNHSRELIDGTLPRDTIDKDINQKVSESGFSSKSAIVPPNKWVSYAVPAAAGQGLQRPLSTHPTFFIDQILSSKTNNGDDRCVRFSEVLAQREFTDCFRLGWLLALDEKNILKIGHLMNLLARYLATDKREQKIFTKIPFSLLNAGFGRLLMIHRVLIALKDGKTDCSTALEQIYGIPIANMHTTEQIHDFITLLNFSRLSFHTLPCLRVASGDELVHDPTDHTIPCLTTAIGNEFVHKATELLRGVTAAMEGADAIEKFLFYALALVIKGADINVRGHDGNGLIHVLISKNFVSGVCTLLQFPQLDVNKGDVLGQKPFDIARRVSGEMVALVMRRKDLIIARPYQLNSKYCACDTVYCSH